MKNIGILGGGISSLAYSYFLGKKTTIIEKESSLGGLCRSFDDNDGVSWDIGPHITFSKNKEILDFITSLAPMNKLKRSNRVFHDGRFVKYPFENDLFALSNSDKRYALNSFLENPYENYKPKNMLDFFYSTFGEGITRLFLEPYNRKIWKYETSFLDLQMVERIPKPPKQDIIDSASGKETEGYLHQLFFHYPEVGGFQTIVDSLEKKIDPKPDIHLSEEIVSISKNKNKHIVDTTLSQYEFDKLVSTLPIHELIKIIKPSPPKEILNAIAKLKYNSIHITSLKIKGDVLGDNFAITIADPKIIFHRVSKLNFLGKNYYKDGFTNLMVEVTFRKDMPEDIPIDELEDRIKSDLFKLKFFSPKDLVEINTRTFKYAYVIYDLDHRKNTDIVLNYLKSINIEPLGRFGTFEYINSDKAIELAKELAEKMKTE
jgi:protoporphyrinogen oxidase